MGRKLDNVWVGGFVVGGIILVIGAVMVFGSGSFFHKKNLFVLYFKGSVKGLSIGSPVVLRGVKVGSVQDIRINATSDSSVFSIPVVIEIDKGLITVPKDRTKKDGGGFMGTFDHFSVEENLKELIDQGLRAQLEMQSMVTGQLLVGLDFHPEKPARLSGVLSEYPEIPTIQTDIEEFTQKIKQVPIEEMFNKIFSIISSVDKSLNAESIGRLLNSLALTLESINKISNSLDTHLPGIASDMEGTVRNARELMENTNREVVALSGPLNKAVTDLQILISEASGLLQTTGIELNSTVKSANRVVEDVNREIKPVSASLKETMERAKDVLGSVKKASDEASVVMMGVNRITGRDSELINNLNTTLSDLSDAARSMRLLAEYLERHPEALIQGKR